MIQKLSTILTAGLLLAAATVPMATTTDDPSALDAVSAAAPADVAAAAAIQPSSDGLTTQSESTQLTVDAEPLVGITIEAGESVVGIGLPFAGKADIGASESPGSLTFDNNNGTSSVALVHDDGAVQVATVIDAPSSPTSFAYPIDVPSGATLVAQGDGAAIINEQGETLGVFEAPWARDAEGTPVPTRYAVNGSALTQIVDHGPEHAYPVVADPTYVTSTFYWSKAQVREMYRGVQNINNICNWLPLPYLAGVGCGAVPSFEDAITRAYYQGKRVKAVYYNCGYTYCNYYRYYVVA